MTLVFWAGGEKLGERSIGITQDNWDRNGPALIGEQENSGIFNWRTCGFTQKTNVSSIHVQIRDTNSDVVGPLDYGGSYEASVTIDP